MRVLLAAEDAVAVVDRLIDGVGVELLRVQFHQVVLDLVRGEVEEEPEQVAAHQHEAHVVVEPHRGLEGHQPQDVAVADLEPREDEQHETAAFVQCQIRTGSGWM